MQLSPHPSAYMSGASSGRKRSHGDKSIAALPSSMGYLPLTLYVPEHQPREIREWTWSSGDTFCPGCFFRSKKNKKNNKNAYVHILFIYYEHGAKCNYIPRQIVTPRILVNSASRDASCVLIHVSYRVRWAHSFGRQTHPNRLHGGRCVIVCLALQESIDESLRFQLRAFGRQQRSIFFEFLLACVYND